MLGVVSGASGKPPKKESEESTINGVSPAVSQLLRKVRLSWLEQVGGPGSPREMVLKKPEMVVGRSEEADISIGSKLISRKHVVFNKSGTSVRCRDLDSSNGMFLNGTRAHAADLYEGDTIQIGDVILIFHEGQ